MASIWERWFGRDVTNSRASYFTDGGKTVAGEAVRASQALESPAVLACVNIISQNIAQLDCYVYEEVDGRVQVATNHQLKRILDNPNMFQTKYDFLSSIVTDILVYGNAYIRVVRSSNQVVTALLPMDPEDIEVKSSATGMPIYHSDRAGEDYTANEVIQIKDVAGHDAEGRSRVELAAQILGPLKAANRLMADTFQTGVSVNYTVELEQSLDDGTREALYNSLRNAYGRGGKQRGGVAVIEGGKMSAVKGATPADADLRELREDCINELASIFRVPQSMVGTGGNITYNNFSAMRSGFYSDTLMPIITNIEQALTKRLINDGRYIRFDVEEIIKGDSASQMSFVVQGVTSGILTPNEAREYLGYDPMEGGDELQAPSGSVEAEDPSAPDPESDQGNVGENPVRDE